MMTNLSDQPVALITGSGRKRVGHVIAMYLAERNYRLALHYHSARKDTEETVRQLREQNVDCEAFRADVASESDVQQLIDSAVELFGHIDLVVTTASIWSPKTLEDLTAADVRLNFDVNALGTFLVARAAGLVMVRQQNGGSIVTIGDWAIARPYIDHAAYFVSKGTIPTMTRVLALELGHRNPRVRVNCIHPGPVMFPDNVTPEEAEELRQSTLVKDGNCPETVAQTVEFLAGNRFITGACLPVDGGRHMYTPSDALRRAV